MIPTNWMEVPAKPRSLIIMAAWNKLQPQFPGYRLEPPTIYLVQGESRHWVVTWVSYGTERLAQTAVEIIRGPSNSPSRRWVAKEVKFLQERSSPLSKADADQAAARIFGAPGLVGRALDSEVASEISKILLEKYGAPKEEAPKKAKAGRPKKQHAAG